MNREILLNWLSALPFEHVLRKREPESVLARWHIEAGAYEGMTEGRVCLMMAAGGAPDDWLDTLATWQGQTWPVCDWIVVGADSEPFTEARARLGLAPPLACLAEVAEGELATLGCDWVIPGRAGDLLHPSLAGTVATSGQRAVAWDRLEAEATRGGIKLLHRVRGPARDPLAELDRDLRGRAFAMLAERWAGHPVEHAWLNRMSRTDSVDWVVVPEPLAIYTEREIPAPAPSSDSWPEREWGVAMERVVGDCVPAITPGRVSIIILYRDRVELTIRAIESILRQATASELELVMVDNGSNDATRVKMASYLAQLPARMRVQSIDYPHAFNHSKQCRIGAQAATGEVLLFLNNDAELLSSDGLDRMARWANVANVASVGGQMVDAQGRGVGGGFRARRSPGPEFNSPVEEATGSVCTTSRITVGNTFACVAVSSQAFEALGGLDEIRFPVGFNDVEYCLRASSLGWRHINLASVKVSHHVGASRLKADEVAQKIRLRQTHPWVAVRGLFEMEREALPPILAAARRPSSIIMN